MPKPRFDIASLTERARDELTRDKKKSVVLAVLAVGICVLLVRATTGTSTPARSQAAMPASSLAPAAATLTESVALAEQEAQAAKERYIHSLERKITRDLFSLSPEVFPPEHARSPVSLVPGKGQADQAGAEKLARKLAQRRLVQAQARALVLQSTVISGNPIAIINGRVSRIGDWINGFQLKAITARNCTLAKRGVGVILEMNN